MFRKIAVKILVMHLSAMSLLFAQSRDPVALWFWGNKSPATAAGVPNNLVMKGAPFTATYRTYYRLREEGNLSLSVWYRNIMDSQSEHPLSAPANDSCSAFRIIAASVADGGISPNGSAMPGTTRQVSWSGSSSKTVARGESFWSDTVGIFLPAGHYLAFTWTVEKQTYDDAIPHPYENQYSCFTKSGSYTSQEASAGFSSTGDYAVAPNTIAYKKSVKRIIGFSVSMNSYAFWVAQAALNLGPFYGVWNLGSGWAQARDAATNKAWLGKAKCCDDAVVCLGVNDLRNGATSEQVLGYISTVVSSLLQISPSKKIILCTVPPFNFTGTAETYWRAINASIRANPPAGVSRVFDLAALLGQAPPNDNLANPAYGDGHPNDNGGKFVGKAFAAFYLDSGVAGNKDTGSISIMWNQTYADSGRSEAHSICQLADSGFFAVGSVRESSGIVKAHFLQTTSSGGLVSLTRSTDGNAMAYDCIASFDHGNVIAGYVPGQTKDENLALAKFDSAGNAMIFRHFDLPGSNRLYSVAQSPDSGLFFTGYVSSADAGNTDIVVMKTDKGGTLQFAKTFGAAGWDCCYALADGGCVFAGGTRSMSHAGGADVIIARLDASGTPVWARIYGGVGDDIAYNLTKTSDGGYAVVGSTSSFSAGQKAFLLKVDSLGLYQWAKPFGGTSTDAAYGVAQLPDGGFMVAGNMSSYSVDSSATVIRTNARGDSIGVVRFKGYIAPGGAPIGEAGNGKKVLCYTAVSGTDTCVGVALLEVK